MRLGAIFVAVCMTVIAVSAGAVVYYAYGFTGADAIMVAISALTALALYNTVSTRMNVKSVVGPQLTELSRGSADLAGGRRRPLAGATAGHSGAFGRHRADAGCRCRCPQHARPARNFASRAGRAERGRRPGTPARHSQRGGGQSHRSASAADRDAAPAQG